MARLGIPFHVKNTFITVDDEDVLGDVDSLNLPLQRWMTEPAYCYSNDAFKNQANMQTAEPEREQDPSRTAAVVEGDAGSNVWSAQAASTGNAANQPSEPEIDEPATSDWGRLITGVELDVQPSMMVPENKAVVKPYPALQPLIVNGTSSLLSNCPNFPKWQMTAGSQKLDSPSMNSKMEVKSQPPPEWGRTTTVMMRNLPSKYTQGLLLGEINAAGFSKTYDFFYLPIDSVTRTNRGYAFINFRDARLSWQFKLHFESRQMIHGEALKAITVVSADLQGFVANYEYYSTCRASKGAPEMRPLFFCDTERHKRSGKPSLIDLAAKNKLTPKKGSVRFCYNCGDEVGPEFKFCRSCGIVVQSRR